MAKAHLTAGRIRDYTLVTHKKQSFLWDATAPGLAVRATSGAKAFIFESRLNGKKLRITVGDVRTWGIDKARAEAPRLQQLIDQGVDPRQDKAEKLAAVETKRQEAQEQQVEAVRKEVTIAEAWEHYLEVMSPDWGEHHYRDHLKVARHEGEPTIRRGGRLSTAGPLAALMPLRVVELTAEGLEEWLKEETAKRPTTTAKAYRIFRAFLNWCSYQAEYSGLVEPDTLLTKAVRKKVASPQAKGDCLEKEQLKLWFDAVRQHTSPVIPAYLQILLLTGARREEMGTLTWDNVDFRWRKLTIRDKTEGERVIPLTPYVAHLLAALPRRNQWVFSSLTSASGRLREPSIFHRKAVAAAGLPHVSLHGLRRSFATLSEWVEIPTGIVAQIQGHKPSALAEKHYRRRPLDLLRKWHIKLEAWILEQAGIEFDAEQEPGLRVVGMHSHG